MLWFNTPRRRGHKDTAQTAAVYMGGLPDGWTLPPGPLGNSCTHDVLRRKGLTAHRRAVRICSTCHMGSGRWTILLPGRDWTGYYPDTDMCFSHCQCQLLAHKWTFVSKTFSFDYISEIFYPQKRSKPSPPGGFFCFFLKFVLVWSITSPPPTALNPTIRTSSI